MNEAQIALRFKMFADLEAKHQRERDELERMFQAAMGAVMPTKIDGRKREHRKPRKPREEAPAPVEVPKGNP